MHVRCYNFSAKGMESCFFCLINTKFWAWISKNIYKTMQCIHFLALCSCNTHWGYNSHLARDNWIYQLKTNYIPWKMQYVIAYPCPNLTYRGCPAKRALSAMRNMAGRAFLAGYHRYMWYVYILDWSKPFTTCHIYFLIKAEWSIYASGN